MPFPVTATSTLDEATLRQGFRWAWRRRWTNYAFLVAGILAVASGAWLFFTRGIQHPTVWLYLLCGFYYLLRYPIRRHFFIKQVRTTPEFGQKLQWQISEEELELSTADSMSRLPLTRIHEIVITPEGYLIYLQKHLYWWLPRTGLSNTADTESVEALFKAKTRCRALG